METRTYNTKVRALAKHIRMSPHKVRRVVNQIRGRSYEQALMILEFMPYRACNPILKILSSAAANASNNFGLSKTSLFISEIQVNKGTFLKRFQPRAQGRGYPIHKPTCHITIVMGIISR
uniref:Large ribosomal subunit protein uL22c n=1 Tax=Apopellia endiviifolia TaxID=304445 RepID=K4K842_9MARC|nr:ribosomal protein L22 [Apopellia endiviifolia]AFU88888.1 ribosomal protein L22 [Apopellia endiviifolia]WIA67771.1 ribosomal protein L22 [Apopellia endiviifolia]WKW94980.1 ribosomal protein L22 [Apopellia endiviifolia]